MDTCPITQWPLIMPIKSFILYLSEKAWFVFLICMAKEFYSCNQRNHYRIISCNFSFSGDLFIVHSSTFLHPQYYDALDIISQWLNYRSVKWKLSNFLNCYIYSISIHFKKLFFSHLISVIEIIGEFLETNASFCFLHIHKHQASSNTELSISRQYHVQLHCYS